MNNRTLKMGWTFFGIAFVLALGLPAPAYAQADPPEHGADGSYSPTRSERTREENVRTPRERAKFVEGQVKKFERADAKARVMSVMALDGHAKATPEFDPSTWSNTYGELVKRYGEHGQVLYLDEYLTALYTTRYNSPEMSDMNVDVKVLLDDKLFKGKGFEYTLRERYTVPAGVATAALKWAKERVKAVNNAAR